MPRFVGSSTTHDKLNLETVLAATCVSGLKRFFYQPRPWLSQLSGSPDAAAESLTLATFAIFGGLLSQPQEAKKGLKTE
jgi:hypothetical protein